MTKILKISFLIYLLFLSNANAYIGPGLALGAALVSLGVLFLIIFLLIAVLYYPLKRIFKKIKNRKK